MHNGTAMGNEILGWDTFNCMSKLGLGKLKNKQKNINHHLSLSVRDSYIYKHGMGCFTFPAEAGTPLLSARSLREAVTCALRQSCDPQLLIPQTCIQ